MQCSTCRAHPLRQTLDVISPLGSERITPMQSVGRLTAGDVYALVEEELD